MASSAGGGGFAFATAGDGFTSVGETLSLLHVQQLDEGSGKTFDTLNEKLHAYTQHINDLHNVASAISAACAQQDQADHIYAAAPSHLAVTEAQRRAQASPSDKQAAYEADQIKAEHEAAKAKHAADTSANQPQLDVHVPELAVTSGMSDGSGSSKVPLPMTVPDDSSGSGSGGGSSSGAGDTSLSSDTSDAGAAAKPMLGGSQQPQMPPMPQQPQAQMPQAGGAAPGAGGGAPQMPPMRGATMPRDSKTKGSDPLDDLRTDLSGDAAAGAGAAAGAAALDRGATMQNAHTKADISGLNRPAVAAGAGATAAQQSGMMTGPMGSGAPGGAGGAGGGKAKARPDIKTANRKQVGLDSVDEAVPGGLFGRLPEQSGLDDAMLANDGDLVGKTWDQMQGKWVTKK